MLCKKNNLLYIHIPKCGGNSIKVFLKENLNAELEFDTWHYPYFFFEDKIILQHFLKFSVVRNPYDRFVSAFSYTYKKVKNKKDYHWKQYPKTYPIFSNYFEGSDLLSSFKTFVHSKHMNDIFENEYPVHFLPQYKFITHRKKRLDFLWKIEEIASFSDYMVKYFNLRELKRIKKKNQSEHAECQLFYDEEIKEIVFEKYKKDFFFLRDNYNINYL